MEYDFLCQGSTVSVTPIKFVDCPSWHFTSDALRHQSGRFFSIRILASGSSEFVYIDQPEVGILGFILIDTGAEKLWLLQNKPEPGNVGIFQLAPTVQATKSNYERVHGGSETAFLSVFQGSGDACIVDVSASEQGDRFIKKFNRNVKVVCQDDVIVSGTPSVYQTVKSSALKALLRTSYCLNTDARSVVATGAWLLLSQNRDRIFLESGEFGSEFHAAMNASYSVHRQQTIALSLARRQEAFGAVRHSVQLLEWKDSQRFRITPDGIYSNCGERIVGYYDCHMPSREVPRWQQPLVEKSSVALYITPVRLQGGLAFIGIRAEAELGFLDRAEFTVGVKSEHVTVATAYGELREQNKYGRLLLSIEQSDEGGRFWRNIGVYAICLIDDSASMHRSDQIFWVTLGELEALTLQSGCVTNELRTAVSLLLSIA